MKRSIIQPAILACSAGLLFAGCQSDQYSHADYDSYSSTSTSSDDSWMRGRGSGDQSQYYSSSSSQSYAAQSQAQSQSEQTAQDNIVIPLHQEQLDVGKQTVNAGQVTIRKVVTTETVNEPIELRHERLVIDRSGSASAAASSRQSADESTAAVQDESEQTSSERAQAQSFDQANEPAGAGAKSSPSDSGAAFQEQTYTIQLKKEVPIIQKSVVQTGQVTARKNSQTEQQNVQQQVRREDVQLDRGGVAAQDLEIRGNFNTAGQQLSEPSGAESRQSLENQPSHQQESLQYDSSQRIDRGVNESTDSTTGNRAPTQGQGAQDLKEQPEDRP